MNSSMSLCSGAMFASIILVFLLIIQNGEILFYFYHSLRLKDSSRFVLMDGDMVYTESRLRALLKGRPCTTDTDCIIGDCKARCTAEMTCSERTNSNLEVSAISRICFHSHHSIRLLR